MEPPDWIERVVERWSVLEPDLDFEPYLVTGRVARIATHLARHQEEVFGRYGLNRGEVGVLSALRIVGPPHRLADRGPWRSSSTARDVRFRCV